MRTLALVLVALFVNSTVTCATTLDSYIAAYEKEVEGILLVYEADKTTLDARYAEALEALLSEVKGAGDLDATTAVLAESGRFDREGKMPDTPAASPRVGKLQSFYAEKASSSEEDKARKILSLATTYDRALERLQRSLVSSDKLDEARLVKDERRKVAESAEVAAARAFEAKHTPTPTPPAPRPKTHQVTVKTFIDGADNLLICGERVWFVHRANALPGEHGGDHKPTYINGARWRPKWKGNTSKPYSKLRPRFEQPIVGDVKLTRKSGRGAVRVVEQPAEENGQTLTISFEDPDPGPEWYEVVIEWQQ